jgi:GR25 family glycosyltransferase involved in LPS biosynthesis
VQSIFLFYLFCLVDSFIFGNLFDHIQPCENKLSNCSYGLIDYIYVINLDERSYKFDRCKYSLSEYGIQPYRFKAVNGWKIDSDSLQAIKMRSGINGGGIGCYLSHLSVITDAYQSGYNVVWILEDDFEIIRSPALILRGVSSLNDLDPSWDMLYTDLHTKSYIGGMYSPVTFQVKRPDLGVRVAFDPSKSYQVSPLIEKICLRYGTYSYLLSRSGMKKILNFVKNFGAYNSIDIEFAFIDGFKAYRFTKNVVSVLLGNTADSATINRIE